MSGEERQSKLNAYITCLKCEVSGKPCDTNCPTQYDAGNMGEIIENLETILKILKQESCGDCISRKAVLNLKQVFHDNAGYETEYVDIEDIKALPPVTPKTDVLDKIRAEILRLDYDIEDVDYDYNDMAQTEMVHIICREEVLQIIDKYKAESEEKG